MQKYMKKWILSLFLVALATGCSVNRTMVAEPPRVSQSEDQRLAYRHFLDGELLDLRNQHQEALVEYFQALLYDPESVQIRKAIGRDLMRLGKSESAIKILKEALQRAPEDKELLNYLAEAYFNEGRFLAATETYEKLYRLMPNNASIQNNLLYLYTQLKLNDRLLEFYRRLARDNPEDSRHVINYAMAAVRAGQADSALAALQTLQKSDSANADLLILEGRILELQKDTTAAVNRYMKALTIDPENDQAIERVYEIYRQQEDWDGIISLLKIVVTNQPDNYRAKGLLAETYFLQKQPDQALPLAEELLEVDNFRTGALDLLGRIYYEKKDYQKAADNFRRITEEEPDSRFGWLYLALSLNQLKQYEKSIGALQRALSILPDDPAILGMYGSTLDAAGKSREAIEPLEKARRLDPDDINHISTLAAIFDKLKLYQKSDSLYEVALQQFPNSALLKNNYAYSLAVRGIELERAKRLCEEALEEEPENGAYLDTMGWIYYQLGQYDLALDYVSRALKTRDESAELYEHLGDIYLKLGNREKANESYLKALELDPSRSDLQNKIVR